MKELDFELVQIVILFFIMALALTFASGQGSNWHLWLGALVLIVPQGRLLTRTIDYRTMKRSAGRYFVVNQIFVGLATALYFVVVTTLT